MITTREKTMVGAFVIAIAAIVVGSLAVLWGMNASKPKKRYFIFFDESVAGLIPGGSVKFQGTDVGVVEKMGVIRDGGIKVRVDIAVDSENPIPTDVQAQLVAQGLTGYRYLELSGTAQGEHDAAKPIPARPSQWVDMIERFTKVSESVAKVLGDENRAELTKALKNVNAFLESGTAVVTSTQSTLERVATRLESVIEEQRAPVAELLRRTNATLAKVERALDENKIAGAIDDLAQVAKDARSVVANVDGVVREVRGTLQQANLAATIADVRSTATATASAARAVTDLTPRLDEDLSRAGRLVDDLRRAAQEFDELARELRERPSLILRDHERPRREIPDRE